MGKEDKLQLEALDEALQDRRCNYKRVKYDLIDPSSVVLGVASDWDWRKERQGS